MIEWLLRNVLVPLAEWVGSAVAALVPPVPSWLVTLIDGIGTVVGYMAQAGMWFPVELLAVCLVVVVGATAAGLGIKLVRIIASFVTLGGGGAG
ncbi:MAG: hypothetical protein QM658_16820 [Gordonia sp. (in: high G+C Gram-positive bacteria)]